MLISGLERLCLNRYTFGPFLIRKRLYASLELADTERGPTTQMWPR